MALPAAGQPSNNNELKLTLLTATKSAEGVLVQWHADSDSDNAGFNIYRLSDGKRTRLNGEIIPGAAFAPHTPLLRGGHSYAWIDPKGDSSSVYYVESVNLQGATKAHEAVSADATSARNAPVFSQTVEAQSPQSPTDANATFEKSYPAAESSLTLTDGPVADQWPIAAQSALKIGIKKDSWYRVTQPQMVAAGFSPTVDIRNLRLFADAKEVAISTSQSSGAFGASDYIEFYGRGLDTPTTDTRTYYLIAGTTPGKRVIGQIQTTEDDTPPPPVSTPNPTPVPEPPAATPRVSPASGRVQPVLSDPIFYSLNLNGPNSLFGGLRSSATPSRTESGAPGKELQAQALTPAVENYSPSFEVNEPSRSAARRTAKSTPNEDSVEAASAETQNDPRQIKANEIKASEQSLPLKSPVTSAVKTRGELPAADKTSPARKSSARTSATNQFRKASTAKKKKRAKARRQARPERQERNHAVLSVAATAGPSNFESTSERKDRGLYFVSVTNGDKENYFGQVVAYIAPPGNMASQTITTPNPDPTALAPARLEIALQGVNQAFHQVSIEFNGVNVGSFPGFFGFDPTSGGHPVQVFNIPASQLINGANTVKFVVTQPQSGSDLSIVDYVKLTYPHAFNTDSGSLKFSLRGSQSRTVDGFASPLVRLIDYTDPFNVIVAKPDSEPTAAGYAITVPPGASLSKTQRLLYALPHNQFDQPASLSLNQPSTLNQGHLSATITNGADFLVVSHKNFIANFSANVSPANTSLLAQRTNRDQMIAAAVDVEDVYDEFGYGVHGPQAVKNFLAHAAANWVTKPRYVVFAGDSTFDPRNYENKGEFDFVPTKLVDATYNETASDDWLSDFDNDGIANIPVGRLPFRTTADATTIISKIVNFVRLDPQSAMLIADEDPFHVYGFVDTSDVFQSLLPPGMLVERINRGVGSPPPSDSQTRANIIAGFNSGKALVNYSGHGNVDVWTSNSLFMASDALALTNGTDKLSFVVVMDCLNGYFQDPALLSLSEAFLKAPNGGAVAAFASSGLTIAQGQHDMGHELYTQLYGGAPIALGDAIKLAKAATFDIDVKRTWIFFGDPSLKVR